MLILTKGSEFGGHGALDALLPEPEGERGFANLEIELVLEPADGLPDGDGVAVIEGKILLRLSEALHAGFGAFFAECGVHFQEGDRGKRGVVRGKFGRGGQARTMVDRNGWVLWEESG